MSKKTKDKPLSETKAEYKQNESEFFRGVDAPKARGAGAADPVVADKHLPSGKVQYDYEQNLIKGFNKSSRSGAFSKASTGFAIRPNGLGFASDFVDRMTPKGWRPPQQRPVPTEQTRKVEAPPAACTITHLCIDCLKPVDQNDAKSIIPVMFIIQEDNLAMNFAMGVELGQIILCVEHKKCARDAQEHGRDKTRLVLVSGGNVATEADIQIAMKYNFPIYPHDGRELTIGQFYLAKRQERLQLQLKDVMIAMDKRSECYRKNRKVETKC